MIDKKSTQYLKRRNSIIAAIVFSNVLFLKLPAQMLCIRLMMWNTIPNSFSDFSDWDLQNVIYGTTVFSIYFFVSERCTPKIAQSKEKQLGKPLLHFVYLMECTLRENGCVLHCWDWPISLIWMEHYKRVSSITIPAYINCI